MPDDSNAIPHDVIQRRYSNLDTETPVLLLPYRIETRFSPQRDRLRIRIYPDQIHIDSHNVALTPKEIALGQAFWLRTWAAPDDETERDAAWAALVDVLGSRRAAWVARSLRPKGTPSPRDLLGDVKKLFPEVPVGNPGPARARLLPDHWCVHGYLDGERVLDEVISVPEDSLVVAPDLTDPDSLPDDGPPVDAAAEWTVDFQAALGKGMALDIPLTGKYAKIRNRGLDELIVFGLRPDDRQGDPAALADLLAAHLYTDGIAFVPRDTPTNNTEEVTAGWTPGDDTVGIYERELTDAYATAPDGSVARDLIDALGLPASAAPARMLHGEFLGDAAASAMNQLLWPITGGIYLETVIRGIDEAPVSDSHIREAHDWLVKYVRGGGPLPALRVAAIPYGVLPVQYINGERDTTTKYRYIERVIGELRHTWRDSLEDVPRMVPLVSRTGGTYENDGAPTDADAEILTILSSQPNPAQYSTRRLPLEYVDTTLGITSVFNLIVELMKLLQYPSDLDRVLERKLGEEWITTIEDQISAVEAARQEVQEDADILEDMLEGRIPLRGDEDEVRAQYEYITGPYGTLYWFDSILLPYLQDHLTRTEPLREIYLDTFPTGLIGEDDPAIFYSRYDDEPVQWPPDAPVIEASQGQAADYLEWLRQYAEALLHGDPAPEPLRDLPDPPPLLYQLLKQSIERTAERDASAYGLLYSMAGALTTRSGLQAPPADRAGRIESVHRTASRATAGQLRAFDTFLKGTKDSNRDTPAGHAVRAIPLDDLTQMAHDVAAAAEITALGPAKQRALLDLSGTLKDVVAWRKDEGIVVGHDDWWDQIPNQFPRPGAPSLGELAEALAILRDMPAERLAHLLPETIGLFGHRLDAWATSLAYERLLAMRQKNPRTLYVGGFAWVENLAPADAPPSQGHILAPSLTHAATAAILRSGWSSRGTPEASSLLATNLRSDRVRLANDLLDGMRQGQRLEDLLGYIFERLLMGDGKLADGSDAPGGKHVWIDPMRKAFGGGTVVDGLALVDARLARTVAQKVQNPPGPLAEIAAEMDAVVAAFDAAGDLLLAESMYQLVQGNLDRAGAALDAAATGEILPPALQVVETPSAGVGVDHRLFVVLSGGRWEHAADSPRARAAPALDGWLSAIMGDPAMIRCRAVVREDPTYTAEVSVEDLGVSALDLVMTVPLSGDLATSEWAARVRHRLLSQVPDPAGKQVDIAFDDAGGGRVSFDEICTLAGALRQLIAQSRALDGLDFVTASDEALRGIDIGELEARVAEATAAFDGALSYLAQAVRDDDARQQAGMLLMAVFDLPGAVPVLGGAISLLQQAEGLLARAEKRRDALERIEDGTTDGERIAAAQARLGAIFGKAYPALPLFTPLDPSALAAAFGSPRADDATVAGWLARVGLVQRGAGALHEASLVADAVKDTSALTLAGAQLPFHPGEAWVGLAAPPPGTGGRVALTACTRAGEDVAAVWASGPVCGLLVDRWLERIPDSEHTAGATFHFDSPAQRPPQSLLLAVPPHGDPWSLDLMADTLRDTLEWARLRAVSPETLRRFGHHLPAAYLEQPLDVTGAGA